MKRIWSKKCKPYDTSCHMKVIQTWHDRFESDIGSLISYLQDLHNSSKRARTECSKNYAKLAELSQAKTRFTFEVSHELKDPLSAVYNILNILIEGYLKGDAQKQIKLLTRARFRVKEVIALLNDLLILSRLEEGTGKLKKKILDIKTILLPVVKEIGKYAKEKAIQFSWQFTDDLPLIFGNPELLKRVFENIIDNAIKYTDPDGVVEMKANRKGKFFLFQVMDTGIGIKEEELPRVFDIFFRGSSARLEDKKEGMGLGLSLVKRIIDDHKGTVNIKSKFGQGTTVILRFPEHKKGGVNGKTSPDSG